MGHGPDIIEENIRVVDLVGVEVEVERDGVVHVGQREVDGRQVARVERDAADAAATREQQVLSRTCNDVSC